VGFRVLEPEQVIFGIGGFMRWLSFIPLLFVVEKRGISLRKAFSVSLLYVLERINCYWENILKRG